MSVPNPSTGPRSHPVWWVIALSLAAIAVNTIWSGLASPKAALAQPVRAAGARGIFAFSGQMSPNTFGIFMVDVDAGTLWCYEYTGAGGAKRLRLASARSWIYDRYLEEFNVEGLTPADVESLVKEQRARIDRLENGNPP